jgi:hypothetical protein
MVMYQPLDLEYWFRYVFSGSIEIFSILGVLMITALGAYFRMSYITYGIFMAMFAIILASAGFNFLLVLLILIFAPILFWWLRRLVE